MRTEVLTLAAIVLAAALGCVSDPSVSKVRLRAEIEDQTNRVVSFWLKSPVPALNEELVLFHGALVNAPLDGTQQDASCFSLGYVRDRDYWSGKCQLVIGESGRRQYVTLYPAMPLKAAAQVRIRAIVPLELDKVIVFEDESVGGNAAQVNSACKP